MTRVFAPLVALFALAYAPQALAARLVFDEVFEIKGEVQKPEITVLVSRENLNKSYDLEKLEETFLPKIVESVKRPPF